MPGSREYANKVSKSVSRSQPHQQSIAEKDDLEPSYPSFSQPRMLAHRALGQQHLVKKRVADKFIWVQHMKALEEASVKGQFAVSFRAAGKATLEALAKGAAAKGHNILEKTIKESSIKNTYGDKRTPEILQRVQEAGIEGYVGAWGTNGLTGIYLSSEHEHDAIIYPIDIDNLEDSLKELKARIAWETIPFTGDYDMHDLITFRGAGRPRSVMSDSKEEHDIIDLINQKIADVDSNRPFSVKQRNVVRHGPQSNFMSYSLAREAKTVQANGGVSGAVARPGEFPVAMLNRGIWAIINNIEELDKYYENVGARIKESWKPGGMRFYKSQGSTQGMVGLGRRPYSDTP